MYECMWNAGHSTAINCSGLLDTEGLLIYSQKTNHYFSFTLSDKLTWGKFKEIELSVINVVFYEFHNESVYDKVITFFYNIFYEKK